MLLQPCNQAAGNGIGFMLSRAVNLSHPIALAHDDVFPPVNEIPGYPTHHACALILAYVVNYKDSTICKVVLTILSSIDIASQYLVTDHLWMTETANVGIGSPIGDFEG